MTTDPQLVEVISQSDGSKVRVPRVLIDAITDAEDAKKRAEQALQEAVRDAAEIRPFDLTRNEAATIWQLLFSGSPAERRLADRLVEWIRDADRSAR